MELFLQILCGGIELAWDSFKSCMKLIFCGLCLILLGITFTEWD